MKIIFHISAAAIIAAATPSYSQSSQLESFYADIWCNAHNGMLEVATKKNTRIDCLTDKYAVEADFDEKWAEGLGQSLHYSAESGKRAAVLLIIQNHNGKDRHRYVDRLRSTIDKNRLDVTVFFIETKDYELRQ